MSTLNWVCVKSQLATTAVKWKISPRMLFPFISESITAQSSNFSLNWKWKYSNGRNKQTANETSNKNTSNNVSFVFSAVSCFHWLLLADKKHNLPFSETFCLLLQIVFFLTLSTVSMMTCDLQVIQSQLLYSSR